LSNDPRDVVICEILSIHGGEDVYMYVRIVTIAIGLLYIIRPDIPGRRAPWGPAILVRFWANTTCVRILGCVFVLLGLLSIARSGK
jgi:hypothetical protein